MKLNSRSIIGYVTPRPFGQFNMPVPAQNSCLREYAASNGFSYGLPQCEHIFDDCYVQLFGTLNDAVKLQDVVIYSLMMLPSKPEDLNVLTSIIEHKSITIHTVLEKVLIRGKEDVLNYKNTKIIQHIIQQNVLSKFS